MLEVFIVGCGGTQPLPRRHLSSIMVRRNGQAFLFDCGEGTQVALKRQGLKWKQITHIISSHIHADHVTGIPGLMMLSSQVERSEPLNIMGPKGLAQFIQGTRDSLNMFINYPVNVVTIEVGPLGSPLQTLFEDEELRVSCFPSIHSQPCVGFLVEEKARPGVFSPEAALALKVPKGPLWSQLQHGHKVCNSEGQEVSPEQVLGPPRKGKRLGFMTDSLYHPIFAEYFSGVDLLICEGMFAEELTETAHEKKHMTAKEAAKLAKEAGAKRLALTHFSPRYTDRQIKDLLPEAQEVFAESFLCYDGLYIELS